jgi:nucleobase transporter 1/2
LAFQQTAVLFSSLICTPFIIGNMAGLNAIQIGSFLSACAFGMGIATLFQLYFGSKLPAMQGPSLAFVSVAGSIFASDKMAALTFSMLLGAFVQVVVGFGGIIGHVRKYLTPVVLGPLVILVGISLFPWATDTASHNILFSFLMLGTVFFINYFMRPKIAAMAPLIALFIGYFISLGGTLTGFFDANSSLFVDLTAVKNAPWFALPMPMQWGIPKFNIAFFLVMLAPYFVIVVEAVGGYVAISEAAGEPKPNAKQINTGIGFEGLGSMLTAFFGGTGAITYTENIALMVLTKVASRFVFTITAIMIIIIGFVPKVGTLFATFPKPVIGGVYMATFGLIIGVGLNMLSEVDLKENRNMTIAGLSIFLGLCLPMYIGNHPVVIPSATWLADVVNGILGTSMAVGGIVALIFDNVLPREKVQKVQEVTEKLDTSVA